MTTITSGSNSLDFNIMIGRPAGLKTRVETWEVPGLDGYGAQDLGKGDAEFSVMLISYEVGTGSDDASTVANAKLFALENLQGEIVSIEDDWSDTFGNVLITGVDTVNSKKPAIYQGSAAVRIQIGIKAVTVLA